MLFEPQVVATHLLAAVALEVVQLWTPIGPVTVVVHAVSTKLLADDAAVGVQVSTAVGPVLIGVGQVVVVQLLAPVAGAGVHAATGTLVVTTGVGQVTVVQLLPALGDAAAQVSTGTLVVSFAAQITLVQLGAVPAVVRVALFVPSVQVAGSTATGDVELVVQIVAVQLLPAEALTGVHVWTATGAVVTGVGQSIVIH